ncbi:MAG: plasmid pRiA4b ORF-3 family protein, partial [Oleiphilaceae bacterium]
LYQIKVSLTGAQPPIWRRLMIGPGTTFLNFVDETTMPASSLLAREGQAVKYEYDFGDSWEHEIKLEKILPGNSSAPVPQCIKAVRQGPPEFLDLIELNPEQTRFRKEDKQVMRQTALFEGMFVRV